MKRIIVKLSAMVAWVCISANAAAEISETTEFHFVVCEAGSWHGDILEYSGDAYKHMQQNKKQGYFKSEKDRYTSPNTIYMIPESQSEPVGIYIYGSKSYPAVIINRYDGPLGSMRTVAYSIGNVPYMDTVFFSSGLVYSSQHKNSASIQTATTFKNFCGVVGPMTPLEFDKMLGVLK